MVQNLIQRWAKAVVEYRWLVIIFTFVFLGAAVYPMKNLYYDNSNELFFLKEDPNIRMFNKLLDRFGDSEYTLIGIEARENERDVFNEETLRVIHKMTDFLEDHEVVTKVSSLSKYQYNHSEDDTLATDNLIEDFEEWEATPEELQKIRSIMEKETMVHGFLITEDFQHTVIIARTEYIKGKNAHHVQLVNDLNTYLEQEKLVEKGFNIHVTGQSLIAERFFTITKSDQAWMNPLISVIMIILLFLSFRTISGMMFPWIVIGAAITLVIGFMGLMGWGFNSVNTALPPILIILGIGDAVHLIVEFYHFRNEGFDPKAAAIKSVEALWLPCFYTSVTTAAGFVSLSVTKLVPIQELGLLGALGAIVTFIISVTFLPAIMSFLTSIPESTKRIVQDGWITRFTNSLTEFTFQNRKFLAILGGITLFVSVFSASQITVDTNFVNYFKEKMPLRQDIEYFDRTYYGGSNIDFMVDSGKEGGAKDPEFLQRVLKLEEFIESFEETGNVNSVIDYIQKLNQSMHNDDPSYFVLPDNRNLIAQYLFLYESTSPDEDLTDLKDTSERYLRLSVRIKNLPASKTEALLQKINAELTTNYADLNVESTGGLILLHAQNLYIMDGMVQSFGLALIIIAFCFFFLFRSFKYGVMALIPSITPILFTGGILAFLDISLDMGTMIVGAMTIGLAVDDSIHVMNRYLQAKREGKSVKESVHLAMTESGRAVIFTSLVLISGFSVMAFGSFIPFIYTGIFSGIIMFMALVGDLIFLPAVLFLVEKEEKEEERVVNLDTITERV